MADSKAKKPTVASATVAKEKDHGPMYWLAVNLWKHCSNFFYGAGVRISKRPLRWAAYVLLSLLLLVYLRPVYSHFLLDVRKYTGTMILIGILLSIMFAFTAGMLRGRLRGALPLLAGVIATSVGLYWAGSIHEYLALYARYKTMNMVEITTLPLTNHERIQPYSSIETAARDVMSDTEAPTPVDFVRDPDGSYRIVMAVEPSYWLSGALFGSVNEILSMPGTSPSVAFGPQYREKVSFNVGERIPLSHNSYNCVVRTFSLWGLLNYEPSNVIYLKDDTGKWVQVVSLIRWTGGFFPRPEFGGVQVIRQNSGGILNYFERSFFGCGEYVPPERIALYPYLRGQSLVSPVVSRFMAESFRYQSGFFSPLPFYHYGDIRMPDMPDEVAEQPFVAHFEFDGDKGGKLYQYFALEPFDDNKRGLATSLFVPADGIGKVLVYNHAARNESLMGTSAVSGNVEATRMEYDWTTNVPVEHLVYIRDVLGQRKIYFRTAIVAKGEQSGGVRHITGSTPKITLTDPVHRTVVWVDPNHPETWVPELEKALRTVEGARVPK